MKNQPANSIVLRSSDTKIILVFFQFLLLLAILLGLLIFSDDHHSGIFNGGISCYSFMLFGVVFSIWLHRPVVITKNHLKAFGYSYPRQIIPRSLTLKWEEIESVDGSKKGMILLNKVSKLDPSIFNIHFETERSEMRSKQSITKTKALKLIKDMCGAQSEKEKDQIFEKFLTVDPLARKLKSFSPMLVIFSQLGLLALIIKIFDS